MMSTTSGIDPKFFTPTAPQPDPNSLLSRPDVALKLLNQYGVPSSCVKDVLDFHDPSQSTWTYMPTTPNPGKTIQFGTQPNGMPKDVRWQNTQLVDHDAWQETPEGGDSQDPSKRTRSYERNRKSGVASDPTKPSDPNTCDTAGKPGNWRDNVDRGRTGLTTEVAYGNYAPKLCDNPNPFVENENLTRNTSHRGFEEVKELNDGEGYSKRNHGAWRNNDDLLDTGHVRCNTWGSGVGGGAGLRGEVFTVVDAPGSGELQLRGNGLMGCEGSAAAKGYFGLFGVSGECGLETRVGLFAEGGLTYQPCTWEPTIFGIPINLSPEVECNGRVFTGAETGARLKASCRLARDSDTGKYTPEVGADAKCAAFVGGKAEGDLGAGVGGNKVVGTAGVLYGAGVEGKAGLGITKIDGKRKLKGELKLGAALGIGLSLGVKAEINLEPLLNFGEKIFDGLKKFGKGIGKAAEKVGDGIGDAARKVGNFFKKLFK